MVSFPFAFLEPAYSQLPGVAADLEPSLLLQARGNQLIATSLLGVAVLAAQAAGYAFVSCTDYDEMEDVCYGYTRNYGYQAPLASHAYNLQDHLPAGTNQNTTSVDPAIQVSCTIS